MVATCSRRTPERRRGWPGSIVDLEESGAVRLNSHSLDGDAAIAHADIPLVEAPAPAG